MSIANVKGKGYSKVKYRDSFALPWFHNNYLKLKPLHSGELNPLLRKLNRKGLLNSKKSTGHIPSLYYWLSHRCGIAFDEADLLLQEKRLFVNGAPVTIPADLEFQLPWEQLENEYNVEVENLEEVRVPALDRASHRDYWYLHLAPSMILDAEESDPRSFVHISKVPQGGGHVLLSAPTMRNHMAGFAIATNDISAAEVFRNPASGNYGVFELTFPQGTPPEVASGVFEKIRRVLKDRYFRSSGEVEPAVVAVRPRSDLATDSTVTVDALESLLQTRYEMVEALTPDDRILVKAGAFLTRDELLELKPLIENIRTLSVGDLVMPPTLTERACVQMGAEAVKALHDYEKKLKTNVVIQSLRQFQSDDEDEAL